MILKVAYASVRVCVRRDAYATGFIPFLYYMKIKEIMYLTNYQATERMTLLIKDTA